MNFKFSKKLFVQLLFISSSILFLSSCNNDDDTTELVDQLKYETLDLSKFDLSDGTATAGGKIWSGTYKEDAELTSGIFKFKHTACQNIIHGWASRYLIVRITLTK